MLTGAGLAKNHFGEHVVSQECYEVLKVSVPVQSVMASAPVCDRILIRGEESEGLNSTTGGK